MITAAEVAQEFSVVLNDAAAAHSLAVAGLQRTMEFFEGVPRVPENPDPTLYFGSGDPNLPDTQMYARWKLSELPAKLAAGGPIRTQLGHQWAVFVYATWEHDFRPRLAASLGCETDQLKVPLIGDLRRIRHDILHCRGVASAENVGKCEVVKHWFAIGEPILISGDHIREFMARVPWADLVRAP